ncbi:MAG: T9SS type A sorting domain-containing protein [Candidatus Cloacimonadaceae bacterium]|nr:T9SS type A sorting domain-containing protein [Candidatus Cloacimonadaceae bacterium]
MKLILQSGSESGVYGGDYYHRTYVWDTVVSNTDPVLPVDAILLSVFPNPFNPETSISYTLPIAGHVSLKIYNSRGQLIQILVDEVRGAGKHIVVWNGKDSSQRSVSSGLYLCRIANDGKHAAKKMLLLK